MKKSFIAVLFLCAMISFSGCEGTSDSESVPLAPTGLSAALNSSGIVTLSWTASADAKEYEIYRSGSKLITDSDSVEDTASVSYTESETLLSNTVYYYAVSAVNAKGSSEKSSIVGINSTTGTVVTVSSSTGTMKIKNSSGKDLTGIYYKDSTGTVWSNNSLTSFAYDSSASLYSLANIPVGIYDFELVTKVTTTLGSQSVNVPYYTFGTNCSISSGSTLTLNVSSASAFSGAVCIFTGNTAVSKVEYNTNNGATWYSLDNNAYSDTASSAIAANDGMLFVDIVTGTTLYFKVTYTDTTTSTQGPKTVSSLQTLTLTF